LASPPLRGSAWLSKSQYGATRVSQHKHPFDLSQSPLLFSPHSNNPLAGAYSSEHIFFNERTTGQNGREQNHRNLVTGSTLWK
jgi:hypothetical protein